MTNPKLTANELFSLVCNLEKEGYVAKDAVQNKTVHKNIMMTIATGISKKDNPFMQDIFDKDAESIIERAKQYLGKLLKIEQQILILNNLYKIYPKNTPKRLMYTTTGNKTKYTAPEILIERLEKGDLSLPSNLEEVLKNSFGLSNCQEFNRNGVHMETFILLNTLGIVEDYGNRAFAKQTYSNPENGIFKSSTEYRKFLDDLTTLSRKLN